jgi:hypothetical protein
MKDAGYCFPCFLFYKKPLEKDGSDKFTAEGFKKWKKLNNGKDCVFLTRMGNASGANQVGTLKRTFEAIPTNIFGT